ESPELRTDTLRWRALNSGRPPARGSGPTLPGEDPRPRVIGTRDLPTATVDRGDSSAHATRFYTGLTGIEATSSAADPFASAWRGAGEGLPSVVDGDPTTAWVSGDRRARQQLTLD